MKLSKYLKDKEITPPEFAKTVGVHTFTIYKLSATHPRPCGRVLALKIRDATGGAVTLEELIDP